MKKLIGPKKIRTAVFISGKGSNLKNLIRYSKIKTYPFSINLIFSFKYSISKSLFKTSKRV